MILEYVKAAMKHARYELLQDDGSYYGEIPLCQGVYSNASNLEYCRNELAAVLEDWILFRIHQHLSLPEIDGLELSVRKDMAA